MTRNARLVILAAAPLLTAALWMDKQPSYRAYEAPVLAPPPGAVPVSGREVVSRQAEAVNPVAANEPSVARGGALFAINCAMCHGQTAAQPGPVGRKITPPPPGLTQQRLRVLSDADIFRAITFGFGRMPPFQDKLDMQERWDLVNFLRSRK